MKPSPLLWIIAPSSDSFDLARLPWCEAASDRISVNPAKFQNLEMVEVIVDAMAFVLSRLTAAEAVPYFSGMEGRSHLPAGTMPSGAAVGVAIGENLLSAGHLPEIHQRLLLLGQWIGESLDATAAVWIPGRSAMGFADYRDAVKDQISGGPTPFRAPVQAAGY
ncbi:hypothetical protein [Parasphingorhabdus sp.]|uniref:hypothetical protein n=1 Tax=Parasphingorhabdus sp. TaxID=2709688 RepID=UPI003002E98E